MIDASIQFSIPDDTRVPRPMHLIYANYLYFLSYKREIKCYEPEYYQCLQILSVKTEDSILRRVLERIKCTASSNDQPVEETQENKRQNVGESSEINDKRNHRAELQKQVEIGEITPFEAVSKQSALEQTEGYVIFHHIS